MQTKRDAIKYGKEDGKAAQTMANKPHKTWPRKGHFNKNYEKAYWEGYYHG